MSLNGCGGPFDPDLSWTCHVCGEERPDALIAVHHVYKMIPNTDATITANVRFCSDRAECHNGAEDVGREWLNLPSLNESQEIENGL